MRIWMKIAAVMKLVGQTFPDRRLVLETVSNLGHTICICRVGRWDSLWRMGRDSQGWMVYYHLIRWNLFVPNRLPACLAVPGSHLAPPQLPDAFPWRQRTGSQRKNGTKRGLLPKSTVANGINYLSAARTFHCLIAISFQIRPVFVFVSAVPQILIPIRCGGAAQVAS